MINNVFRCLTYFLIIGFTLFIVSGCDEDDNPSLDNSNEPLTNENVEQVVKDYVDVNANLRMARNVNSGILPFNATEGLTGKSFVTGLQQLVNAKTFTDSVNIDFCGEIDLNINNGKIILTIDFGEEGCEQGGNLFKGMIIESYSFSNDSLFESSVYENFSFNDVTINGTSQSSFALISLEDDNFKVSWSEDLSVQIGNESAYSLKSSLCSTYNGQSVVLDGYSSIEEANGDNYATTITSSLIYTLDCIEANVYAPVEGEELLVYNGDSVQINYGNGECDYLIEITREGETKVVDLTTVYKDIEFAFGFWFIGYHQYDEDDDFDCLKLSEEIVNDSRTLPVFNSVAVNGIARLHLAQGDQQEVVVKAPENLLPFVLTNVASEKLMVTLADSICLENYFEHESLLDIYLTLPELSGIEVNGVGSVDASSLWEGDSLYIGIAGASEVDFPINYEQLIVNAKGASKLILEGEVGTQELEMAGASYVDAFELVSNNCKINIIGAGKAKVTVNNELKVTIDGAGKVYYKGSPEITSSLGLIGELINAN